MPDIQTQADAWNVVSGPLIPASTGLQEPRQIITRSTLTEIPAFPTTNSQDASSNTSSPKESGIPWAILSPMEATKRTDISEGQVSQPRTITAPKPARDDSMIVDRSNVELIRAGTAIEASNIQPPGLLSPPRPPPNDSQEFNRQEVQEAARAQEEMQDTREELLGVRFALRTRRKQLSDLRRKTGIVAGSVFDQLRQLLREHGIPVPEKLESDYHDLGALRDHLGSSEVEYDQDEQKYNGLEYKYTQREGTFIEAIMSNGTLPRKVTDAEQRAETEALTSFAYGPKENIKIPSYSDFGSSIQEYLETPPAAVSRTEPWRMIECKDPVRQEDCRINMPLSSFTASSLPQLSPSRHRTFQLEAPSAPYSENALSNARLSWPDTLKRIDSWILDMTRCSKVQKAILKTFLFREVSDDPSWWRLVEKHWNSVNYDNISPVMGADCVSTSCGIAGGRNSTTPVSSFPQRPLKDDSSEPLYPKLISPSDRPIQRVNVHGGLSKIPQFLLTPHASSHSVDSSKTALIGLVQYGNMDTPAHNFRQDNSLEPGSYGSEYAPKSSTVINSKHPLLFPATEYHLCPDLSPRRRSENAFDQLDHTRRPTDLEHVANSLEHPSTDGCQLVRSRSDPGSLEWSTTFEGSTRFTKSQISNFESTDAHSDTLSAPVQPWMGPLSPPESHTPPLFYQYSVSRGEFQSHLHRSLNA